MLVVTPGLNLSCGDLLSEGRIYRTSSVAPANPRPQLIQIQTGGIMPRPKGSKNKHKNNNNLTFEYTTDLTGIKEQLLALVKALNSEPCVRSCDNERATFAEIKGIASAMVLYMDEISILFNTAQEDHDNSVG